MINLDKFEKECLFNFDTFFYSSPNQNVIAIGVKRLIQGESATYNLIKQHFIDQYKKELLYKIYEMLISKEDIYCFWINQNGELGYISEQDLKPDSLSCLFINYQGFKTFNREIKINSILE
jgi:hypothetical protein